VQRYETADCEKAGDDVSGTVGIEEADGQEGRMTGSLPLAAPWATGMTKAVSRRRE
jgi:hypothetical protein